MDQIHTFKVVGKSPVLMGNAEGMIAQSEGNGTSSKQSGKPKKSDAEKLLYQMTSGQLFAPSTWFRGCLMGKKSGATGQRIQGASAPGLLMGSVFTVEYECPLFHPETEKPISQWEAYPRVIHNEKTGRSVVWCPKVMPWACLVTLEIDRDILGNLNDLWWIFQRAGKVAGVGVWRVNKMGEFGRFAVEPYGHTAEACAAEAGKKVKPPKMEEDNLEEDNEDE